LGRAELYFVDMLYRRRLLTLLSVDDMIGRLVTTLEGLGVLDETFIFFTADVGLIL
jgi:N-acetylglucosamine-6-sulfatase